MLLQHLPTVEQYNEQNSKEKLIQQQPFTFIQIYFIQGLSPPLSIHKRLENLDMSDIDFGIKLSVE